MDGIEHPADRWHAREIEHKAQIKSRNWRAVHIAADARAFSTCARIALCPPPRPVGFIERVVRRVFG